jgi:hypothetical protein
MISGHFAVDMAKSNFGAPKRERRAFPTPSLLSPPEAGISQGNARRSQSAGQAEVLLVSDRASSGFVTRPAEPQLTCGANIPAIGDAYRLPAVKDVQTVAAH